MSQADDKIRNDFIVALRSGAPEEDAAIIAGTDLDTIQEWMEDDDDFATRVQVVQPELRVLAAGYLRQHMKENPSVAARVYDSLEAQRKLDRLRELTTDA
jgi:anti-sigma-K factor RskA